MKIRISMVETLFLVAIYLISLYLRLEPRLEIDAHLLTFQGDIWYRLCMAQYIFDHQTLPEPDIRYESYGYVPMWYPPVSPVFFALLSYLSGLDIPTVSSRILPFIESIAPLSLYFLARHIYSQKVAFIATTALALTPSFVFWSGISDPQSFTLFLIPIFILLWVWHSKSPPSNLRLLGIGILLGTNFILHLSYFVVILVLLMVTIALVLKKEAERRLLADLGKAVLLSQILTSPWWLLSKLDMPEQFSFIQKNLYWWWINALVTSSGMYKPAQQLEEYGIFAALAGIAAFVYVLSRGKKHLLLVLWALPLILETQNEVILSALNKIELSWSTLAKPLEGYRFYCFLAQPLAIAIGVALSDFLERTSKKIAPALIVLFALGLIAGMHYYDMPARFQNSGLVIDEYEAAKWFRDNSKPGDRIIADYYRAQMFGGVSGGRVLQGGEFPLRNVDYPYIKAPGEVLNHLFILYNTTDAKIAYEIARRYNATHIFYSDNMIRYGNLLSYYKPASEYGVDTDKKKFLNEEFFEVVYMKDSQYGEIMIVMVKESEVLHECD